MAYPSDSQFLEGWTRQIRLDKGLSEKAKIDVGVPQGSPLSAILFTIYTDEIRSGENICVTKYADDTAISCKIAKKSVIGDQMEYQTFVNDVVSKCDDKNLLLNPKKSKEMCFVNKNVKHTGLLQCKSESIIINGSEVANCTKTDYLGVCIDDKLSFTPHISKMLSKVYYIVSSLSYILSFCNFNARMNLFKSVIISQLLYAVPVWYHLLLEKDKDRIKKFLRYTSKIFNLDYFTLICILNDRAKSDFSAIARKINSTESHPLHNVLQSLLVKTNRNVRNPNIVPKFRIQLYKHSFIYQAALFIQNGQLRSLL